MSLAAEMRQATRALLRQPSSTLLVLLTLAVGLGAATTVFTVADALLLAPLPFAEEPRLVRLYEHDVQEGRRYGQLTVADVQAYREGSRQLEALAAVRWASFTLTGRGQAVRVAGLRASASLFDVLGVAAAQGRLFLPGDEREGAPRVAVATHGFWRRAFAGQAPGVSAVIDGEAATIVGVLPAGFISPVGGEPELFMPSDFAALARDAQRARRMHVFSALGRLAPGAELAAAQAELGALADRLAAEHPQESRGHRPQLVPLREGLVRFARPTLQALSAAVALLLLLSLANVAGLVLSRTLAAQRDLAVRTALGAGRSRLVRGVLLEALLLSLGGALLGALAAAGGVKGFAALVGPEFFVVAPAPSWRLFAFATLLALVSGTLCGLLPAWSATGFQTAGVLRWGGRGGTGAVRPRLRAALVAVQVALALVLLSSTGLLLRTVTLLQEVDPGFDDTGVWTFRTSLPGTAYDSGPRRQAVVEAVLERLQATPGVLAASAAYTLPFVDASTTSLRLGGARREAGPDPEVGYNSVAPGFFRTLGVRILRGRAIEPRDTAGAPPVVVVNAALAARFFPGQDAVGQRVGIGSDTPAPPYEIVGVAADVRRQGLDSEPAPEVYLALAQDTTPAPVILVKTAADPAGAREWCRTALAAVDPDLPLYQERPLSAVVAEGLVARRVVLALLGVFAAAAVFLAAVGIYGVVAELVLQRRRDLGLRLAVGATRADVLRLVLGWGLLPVAAGVVGGLLLAGFTGRSLAALLHGVRPFEPAVHAGMAGLILAVGALASYLPGRRAALIAPAEALRD